MSDYTELGSRLGGTCGDRADKWADAFCQHYKKHNFVIDKDLMLGWFANAIECSGIARTDKSKGE